MKLNIEELAKQAGLHVITSPIDRDEYKEKLEAFASLIVERCAAECDELAELNRNSPTDSMWEQEECAAAIRNMISQK